MQLSLRTALAVGAAVVLSITAGCGVVTSSVATPAASGSASGGFQVADWIKKDIESGAKLKIRLSYHDPSLAFAVPIREGMEKAAAELGADVQMIGPAGGNAASQVSELQTLINQKQIDGLAVSSASNDALKPVIAQAVSAGIPIISFNTNNADSKQMAFVGQDLVASGVSLADELKKVLNGAKGKVVVVSVDSGAGWSNDRFSGFKKGIADAGLDIVGPINTGNEPSASYNTVQNTMAGNKGAIALVSLDCCSLTAGAKWVEQSGNKDKIKVIGFDLQPQTKEFLKSGIIQTTISQAPGEQGYQAVKVLFDFLKSATPIKDVDTGVKVITIDNVDSVPVEG